MLHRKGHTHAVGRAKMRDIFGELVQSVASGGGTAHHNLQCFVTDSAEGGLDLGFMMDGVGKRKLVADSGIRQQRRRRQNAKNKFRWQVLMVNGAGLEIGFAVHLHSLHAKLRLHVDGSITRHKLQIRLSLQH